MNRLLSSSDTLPTLKEILELNLDQIKQDYANGMKDLRGIFKSYSKEFKELDSKIQSYRKEKAKPEVRRRKTRAGIDKIQPRKTINDQ